MTTDRDKLWQFNTDLASLFDNLLGKFAPINKASKFSEALPTANADILAADVTPTNIRGYIRVYFCATVAGVLSVARTYGATTLAEKLNSGNTLIANCAYMFDVPWRVGDSINLQYSVTSGTITYLSIDEFGGGI